MTHPPFIYWIAFSHVSGIGSARLKVLLDYFGDIDQAWLAERAELRAIGLPQQAVENLVQTRQSFDFDDQLRKIEKAGVTVLTWDDVDYPTLLKKVPDPPLTLYVKGELSPADDLAVALVGTRSPTAYGKEVVRQLAEGLVQQKITVVSGLAYGIDTVAHRTVVEQEGRTLAVLGCGVDVVYPPPNRKLSEQITTHGALVSEFPLGTRPEGKNFPRRNRIISGLSLGTVVVEGSIKSGACITANFATEQGRDVFAVPGPIFNKTSQGPNHLIQNGAKLVTAIGDILEELNLEMVVQQAEARAIIPDNPTEATILRHLTQEPLHINDLGELTDLPSAELSSALTMMELKGMVRQVGSMNYVRVSR